jgi:hypothetical protein
VEQQIAFKSSNTGNIAHKKEIASGNMQKSEILLIV